MEIKLMTLKETAAYLKLGEQAVSRMAQNGEIPGSKVGGQWQFTYSAVQAWASQRNRASVAPQRRPAEPTGGSEPLAVAGVLSADRINLSLRAKDRDGVLRELVGLVIEPSEKRLAEMLFQALKAREDLCPTCVSEGVAIPHARNALVGLVEHPVLAYGRHRAGVDFGAFDGKPIHHFFLLCAPNVRDHLFVLAQLSRLLSQPDFRTRLGAADTPDQVSDVVRQAEQAITR